MCVKNTRFPGPSLGDPDSVGLVQPKRLDLYPYSRRLLGLAMIKKTS